ncbi:MAG: NADP-dependent oxidoreductase, partial [Acidobacteria bacterium]|nr:NADP-dependent oxidoreductase [Acidobacteriota bacterium]
MENMLNKQILLASRPVGMPTAENFKLVETDAPQPAEGEVLIRTLYLSVDPYMRGRMSDRRSYVAPFEVGEVITGGVIGEVVESRSENFQAGDIVTGMLGWQLYSVAKGDDAEVGGIRKVDPRLAPVTTALGVLGIPGLTAYFGLLDIGQPREGETVAVSGAAGAVGTIVCQLAKIKGCRVIGIAGSDEKNAYLKDELGVDETINYKSAGDINEAVKEAAPEGVDVYFDNVGGEISDAVMMRLKHGARIIICGQISMYNLEKLDVGPRIQPVLLVTSSLMKGFIVTDYASRFAEGVTELSKLLAQGKLKYAEHVVEGFEQTPQAFLG